MDLIRGSLGSGVAAVGFYALVASLLLFFMPLKVVDCYSHPKC